MPGGSRIRVLILLELVFRMIIQSSGIRRGIHQGNCPLVELCSVSTKVLSFCRLPVSNGITCACTTSVCSSSAVCSNALTAAWDNSLIRAIIQFYRFDCSLAIQTTSRLAVIHTMPSRIPVLAVPCSNPPRPASNTVSVPPDSRTGRSEAMSPGNMAVPR